MSIVKSQINQIGLQKNMIKVKLKSTTKTFKN